MTRELQPVQPVPCAVRELTRPTFGRHGFRPSRIRLSLNTGRNCLNTCLPINFTLLLNMLLNVNDVVHVYNRGIDKQTVFFSDDDFIDFIDRTKSLIVPRCHVLAWCLMTNHFHFLVHLHAQSIEPKVHGNVTTTHWKDGFRLLQSRYANSINKKRSRCGSLFQQRTHYKVVNDPVARISCLQYIHSNPVTAGLVAAPELWRYSSYNQHLKHFPGGICNLSAAESILDLSFNNLLLNQEMVAQTKQAIF
jgi:REP element-mobilizing transposase RayT